MLTDQKMIEGCKAGNRRTQNQLYRTFSPAMLGVCMRYACNLAEAEDMLQEGFVKIFSKIGSYKGSGPLIGWIRRIIVNTALNHLRQNNKFRIVEYIPEFSEDQPDEDEEENAYPFISAEDLLEIIQNLPEGYRIVFNLYAIEKYSHKEIAGMLGISEGTSKSQLSKARQYLKHKLESIQNRSILAAH
jgi:RNA polymerase sigma factor (sigma-70 family)